MTSYLLSVFREQLATMKISKQKNSKKTDDHAGAGPLRVLDFCSGSGFLGKAAYQILKNKQKHPEHEQPAASLDLLDNDSLALLAARKNVPEASRYFLSDCWSTISSSSAKDDFQYDLILSNPPVHRGHADSFLVVEELLRGAFAPLAPEDASNKGTDSTSGTTSRAQGRGGFLKKKGELWMVAQNHIPVGHILHHVLHRHAVEVEAEMYSNGRFSVWRIKRRKDKKTK